MAKTRGGWLMRYGYHSPGDTFLVHELDIKAQPGWFEPIERLEDRTVSVPEVKTKEIAPPPTMKEDEQQAFEYTGEMEPTAEEPFDLQIIPGVTPSIEKRLIEAGLDSPEKLLEAGKDLENIKGIGPSTREAIIMTLQSEPQSEDVGEVVEELTKLLS
jgi:predicted flap endonuclease-1-like 5' DNA nuclease